MFSLTQGTPGRSAQMPRTIRSIDTPACDARYSIRMMPTSQSELHLTMIRAGRPWRACVISRATSFANRRRSAIGATSSSR